MAAGGQGPGDGFALGAAHGHGEPPRVHAGGVGALLLA